MGTDIENGHVDPGEGESGKDWETGIGIFTVPRVKQRAVGVCCIAQGAQLCALPGVGWRQGGEGDSRGEGCMYACN